MNPSKRLYRTDHVGTVMASWMVSGQRQAKIMLHKLPDIFWPEAQPGTDLDYTFDTAPNLEPIQDSIASVSVSVQPSGTGELQIENLVVDGFAITIFLSSSMGRPEPYLVRLVVTTAANPPRVFVYLIGLQISPLLDTPPLQPPESPFFGTPVTWPT